ncbi:hypothetical protein SAMN05660776_1484 [Salegentibacter holothuriorum]|uniref:Uncharacterized protein n=1 Tax=Salegentibacter holothuriorum TaxID=241145 RepID=A0A1T5BTU4_9FLAO|nr:hypothetical protein [Salegentibacter holothuriorum]SKB50577.1 hypothetical protein SAMN05660776_1484 [Salegentibacter holothuriorum]
MSIPQEHLPKDRDATSEQEWGFTIWEFIADNWLYLLGILLILAIFFYARYNWRRRQAKNRMN